jgi:methylated-DNA-[protein]-cysteine S-methyltransferase
MMRYSVLESPAGPLVVAGRAGFVEVVRFGVEVGEGWEEGGMEEAVEQLGEYFAGRRRAFELEVRLKGTAFQERVWGALREIGYGETVTYGELARRLGQPAAVRAVGLANGANRVAIVVPCHRVVGAGGQLTGYAGGVDVKRRLLELERGEGLLGVG